LAGRHRVRVTVPGQVHDLMEGLHDGPMHSLRLFGDAVCRLDPIAPGEGLLQVGAASRQAHIVLKPHGRGENPDGLETPRLFGKPAPCGRACVAAVDDAMRAHQPHGGRATIQQSGLACCLTAVWVTHSRGWARCARASLGTYALAALAWMLRPRQLPGDALLVARVRVMLRSHGITSGPLILDATDTARAKAAKALAPL
jgi:hypothetical protein